MDQIQICPYCRFTPATPSHFCPNCGKPMSNNSLSTNPAKEILVYLISFFIPPLGLWQGIKYLKQEGEKAKRIGFIAIILTVISLIITILISKSFISGLTQTLNSQMSLPSISF